MLRFVTENNVLYKHQYGFRPKFTTEQPILQLLDHIAKANDRPTKDLTLAIFLDLSKAFDSVNHRILLRKLAHYGFRGIANDWFKDYLCNRNQFVEINFMNTNMRDSQIFNSGAPQKPSFRSSKLSVQCGVPQGSILGPLLFLLYVNDLANSTSLGVVSYADDTTLFCSGHNKEILENKINIELDKVYKWLCANKLLLNIDKTKCQIYLDLEIQKPNLQNYQ
jgi:hypothetical protein